MNVLYFDNSSEFYYVKEIKFRIFVQTRWIKV